MNKCEKCGYLNEFARATCEECEAEIEFKTIEVKEWPQEAGHDPARVRREKWSSPKVKTFEGPSYKRRAIEAQANSWMASSKVRLVSTSSHTRKGPGSEYVCIMVTYQELVDDRSGSADGCAASFVFLLTSVGASLYAIHTLLQS